jgi:hypothetical protein
MHKYLFKFFLKVPKFKSIFYSLVNKFFNFILFFIVVDSHGAVDIETQTNFIYITGLYPLVCFLELGSANSVTKFISSRKRNNNLNPIFYLFLIALLSFVILLLADFFLFNNEDLSLKFLRVFYYFIFSLGIISLGIERIMIISNKIITYNKYAFLLNILITVYLVINFGNLGIIISIFLVNFTNFIFPLIFFTKQIIKIYSKKINWDNVKTLLNNGIQYSILTILIVTFFGIDYVYIQNFGEKNLKDYILTQRFFQILLIPLYYIAYFNMSSFIGSNRVQKKNVILSRFKIFFGQFYGFILLLAFFSTCLGLFYLAKYQIDIHFIILYAFRTLIESLFWFVLFYLNIYRYIKIKYLGAMIILVILSKLVALHIFSFTYFMLFSLTIPILFLYYVNRVFK